VLVRGLIDGGAVRLILVEATAPARHTRLVHGLGTDAARLGAEALLAAALNAAHIKGEEQLSLPLLGESPRASCYADVTSAGAVRARVTPSDLQLDHGRLSGHMLAIKSLGHQELYRGITEVAGTTIEQALAEHLEQSAQVHDVLRLGVRQDAEGEILQAGGLLLERLPEEPDHPSLGPDAFEARYGWVRDADIFELLTQTAFGSLGEAAVEVLDRTALRWTCRCSSERVQVALSTLGPDELRDMIERDGGAEVSCDFCSSVFRFDEAGLQALLDELQ